MAFSCRSCVDSGADPAGEPVGDRFAASFESVVGLEAAPATPAGEVVDEISPMGAARFVPFIPLLLLAAFIGLTSVSGGETESTVPRLRPVPSGARRRAFVVCAKCGQGKKVDGPCKRCGGLENC